ncbi:MAG TPA: hypothetical protein DEB37_04695 [Lysinibacillus sp.]|uniref:Uncharacterized protein n=1 Tax=Lysinibacillus fusiformis TaxID=28031 RepID=A0A2I0UY90_9BACI|nr:MULTISPECIES: hypothetical protein [Lysinibacillus]KUF31261.1 hypothetical protein AK833_16090 [Lysinibacillus sp. F5]PKU51043.1 hypothetical protein CRI88_15315 [Lysinibacillus fusiformis]HBT71578.1 hypothetical protein [Lysinibacillus sp.]
MELQLDEVLFVMLKNSPFKDEAVGNPHSFFMLLYPYAFVPKVKRPLLRDAIAMFKKPSLLSNIG